MKRNSMNQIRVFNGINYMILIECVICNRLICGETCGMNIRRITITIWI